MSATDILDEVLRSLGIDTYGVSITFIPAEQPPSQTQLPPHKCAVEECPNLGKWYPIGQAWGLWLCDAHAKEMIRKEMKKIITP